MSGAATTVSQTLLEREKELALLHDAINAAASGDGRLVVIEGGIGIGKTRLLAEARTLAGTAVLRGLHARGGELEGDFAFGVVRQLFEPLLATASPELRDELFAGAAALAEPLFVARELGERDVALADASFAVLHGLYWLTANLAFDRPLLVALDDAHWFDTPSLHWLVYLAHRIEGLPLVVVATTRPEQDAREPSLLAELMGDPQAEVLRPSTLGRSSIALLAGELHGLKPDASFNAALDEATGGNPLFVRALLDTVAREEIAPTAEQAPHLRDLAADGVSRLVALRLARLPPDAVGLARALAILGDQTDLARAAALARVDVDRLDLAAEALSTSGLVARQAPLEFSHPIVRSAVLDGIGAVGRARLHREAAALLGGAGARPELVAAHLLQVPPAGDPFVVDALRRAAIGALAQGSADSATVYLTRALREGSAVGRAELLFELGSAELRTSATDAAGHLSEALAESGDLGTRPDVALALVHSLDLLARADDAFALLERLSAALPPDARDLRWAVEARLAAAGHQSPERHGSASRRLGEIDLDLVGSGSGAGMLLAVAALDEAHRGVDRARTIELAERACGSSLRDAPGERLWLLRAFQSLLFAGRAGQAANGLAEAIRTAQEEGDLLTLTAFQVFSALLRLHVGDLRGAEEDLQPLAPDAFRGLATFSSYRNAFLAQILLERGMTDEAVALFADDPGPAVEGYRIGFLLSRSSAYLSASRADEAAADALAAGDIAKAIGSGNPAATPWRSRAARALHRSGRTEEAVGLAREEVARAERWGAPAPLGVALGTLGLVEGGSSGERLLREAVLKLVDSPARLEHARALVELGAALRRANHRSEARDRLRQGVDLAQALGATALATRGNEEIAATGARPRKQLVTGLDALTASERRVAQLAAEGMTNKEIAQALFVTVKTVELHLSSSYRKLDIRSRGQLATVLA